MVRLIAIIEKADGFTRGGLSTYEADCIGDLIVLLEEAVW